MSGEGGGAAEKRRADVHRLLSVVELFAAAVPASYLCLRFMPMAMTVLLAIPEAVRAPARGHSWGAWLMVPVLGLWAMPAMWGVLLERGVFGRAAADRVASPPPNASAGRMCRRR